MPARRPPLVGRVRWRLANALWPERLRPNKLVTRWRLRACEAEAVARWQAAGGEATGRPRPEARSQSGEDALLWDLIGEKDNGFFVEAGAYDGYTFSVSYLFECSGWNGVLVEPLPDRAAECAARRTSSRVVTAALSRPGAPKTATFKRVPWFEMYSAFEPADPQLGFPDEDNDDLVEERTQVLTLDEVLEGHTGEIDFVVLDVEGHELAALEGFDLDRWQPTALLLEENDPERVAELRRHVEGRGYAYVGSLDQNQLFLRRSETERADRLGPYWHDVRLTDSR
jgi:FkbM family methyltransferase